ncbi:mucin-binding protein [Streptococcus mitis]|uniref:mucin-binding protein n=1 Tax=Streptococcus mitis TaxID=28037 RepID=UPI002283A554|nr:GEVED domain-containing protein [Streptococcus mitis]
MYKSKRQKNKSFDWYGLSQRFSIRKYHFGAASVLLGTALILGAAQTTAKAEETASENKTEAVASAPKDDKVGENVANVTTPALSATTEAAVVEKPTLSDEEVAKLAAEASKKDDKAAETATTEKTEAADKEKATLTAPLTDKKAEKAVDEKADKKDEKKAENPITATKTVLEQLTSEAEVLNTTASNFADKKAEDKAGKEAIATAVASAKVQIEASKKALAAGEITKQELDAQLQRISSAIEAVYAEMKRAGHVGKVEAVLADGAGSTVAIANPINKVVVNNFGDITEEEARAIEKEIRTANPSLTAEDKIEVKRKGNTGAAVATVTLANGKVDQNGSKTYNFAIGDVAYGSAGEKNYSQLREAINWFNFATASITYADGTKVGAIEYVNNPSMVDFTSSKGRQERGRFTMVRTVLESTTHPELVGKKTNDPAFLASGLAKYTLWKTYDHVNHEVQQGLSEGRFNNEIFEVLQEGMRFDVPTKVKGYTLIATVSSLSRKKVTTETYTLNKANGEPENINRSPVDGVVQREDVIVTRQDPNWSHLRLAGFETKYEDSNGITREQLTAFAPAYDGGNVGVKFQLSATYNGRPVAVNAIAVDSEDLNVDEFTQFESDGTPWEEFMRLNKNKTGSKGLFPNRDGNGKFLITYDRRNPKTRIPTGYKLSEWTNKTERGYGSQLFGPFDSGVNNGYDLPIGLSQNVENLGVYINSDGSQSATVGFVIYDGGDAPGSYGSAQHIIGNFNKDKNGTQVTATQPYLGDVPADTDFRTTTAEPNGAWVLDDLVNSEDYKEISLVSGSTQVTNSKGQSGTYLLDGKNPVIRMADGTQVAIKNGEILSTANTLQGGDGLPIKGLYNQATRGVGVGNLPDEGEGQLLDPAVATKYTLRHASENEYILKGVKVNRGVNNDVAYVRGWVDFNVNGKFDLYESSELVTANADGTYDITFKNTPQLLNTSVDNLGVRLRISVDKNDLRRPTGLASSGEVEDFVANVIHQPRGTRHETKDYQGKKQEVNFPTNAIFTASGKTIESNYKQWAQIDDNTAPKMVLNDTVVKSEEPTGKTVEVKDKLSQTIYNGTEVVVKDARGNTLGTAVKVLNKLTGKTEYYLSEYTEYDTAGNKVGVYKLNEDSAENKNSKQGSLSFTKITFEPEKGFVGTAKGVAIRAWDNNGSHTGWEATEDTIRESLTSTTLAEKDKVLENVNNGNNGAKSMDTSYIPTVIDVRPVGEDTTTEDVQGKPQSSNPSIPTKGTVETITNESVETSKRVDILNTSEKPTFEDLMNVTLPDAVHIDPETGEVTTVPRSYTKVTDTEIVIENEGTYTLNQDTGEITFTPHPKFVGTGTGVVKQQPDIDYNDKVAGDSVTSQYGTDYGRAKYTPIVNPQSKASITRTIHYVYENDNDNPSSQDSYKDNDPILAIDNTPVTHTQTIDYTRDYKIFSEAGATATDLVTANQVTDAAGHVYNVGDTIPAGTKFNQGSIIIGKWTASSDEKSKFREIISPTVKGYTAEVVTADFTPRADGKMGHIHNGKQPVGLYTPVADNTKDVGAYEPLVSEVRADNKDDFDMYVVYKADTQKAKVTYIDLDATGDARILEVQNANPAPSTGADAKTTYGVTTLQGKSHTKIPYTTAKTIEKYEGLGYELVKDDYTNNTQDTAIEGGRKFDDDKEVDQAFIVYLRHKKVEVSDSEKQTVTRTIEYKYADTDDVPTDKRNTTAAPSVVETLQYTRSRTIDLVLAAKAYPTEYATYKAEAAKGSDAEKTARTVLLNHVASKVAEATATADQKAIITFGQWTPKEGKATGIELSTEEKTKDNKFNNVPSPEVTGYVPDNATVEATATIDAEADDYKITVLYTPVAQKAVVKFVEVDPTNTDKVITPGLAEPISVTGKSEAAYPATTATSVTDKIAELVKKGYELVNNGFVSTDKFDKDAAVDQEYVVKFKAKVVDIPSFDPTKPESNENPKPTPDVTPIDPNNPDGPKWTEALINAVKVQEEVTRTIKYVYEDGTPVAESDLTSVADKKVKTLKFTRSGKINVATGEITYGDWSANQTFEAVTSPTLEKYTAAVAGVTPTTADVPAKPVSATDKDFEETVIYSAKTINIDPNKPTDPTNPNVTPKPDDKVPNDPKGRTYKELGLIEEVTHTVHYKLADGSDAGIPDNVQTLTFTRTADLDLVTGAISNFSDWKAKGDDTTIDAVTTPNKPGKPGYVASAAKSTERKNVTATDKDSEETIIYRKLGSYVPVIPEGVTPPPGTDLTPKPYENPTNEDPTKPGTPTETPVVPYIPGTTPVGPDGKPLTPKDPNDPTKGYEVPNVPKDPTQNTTITYVKDGSQVALVHFIKADGTVVHVSVAEAGDTGKAIKTTNIDNVKAELEAKGYEVVAPTDPAYTTERVAFYADANHTFDDKDDKGNDGISQVYYVIVKEGITPIDPDKPIDPTKPDLPKPEDKVPGDPKQRTYEQLGLLDEVNRTINYRYANTDKVEEAKRGKEAAVTVEQNLRYSRKGNLNKVTGEITYTSDWTEPQTLAEVISPVIEGYVADIKAAEKVENVAHDAADSVVNVVYTPLGKYVPKVPEGFEVPKVEKPQYPNDPTDPTKPGTPTTVIPHVPGTTPKDPNGNPLKPVDPTDPSKGYVPPTPENPTEDTEITYATDKQKAITNFVDEKGKVVSTPVVDEGDSGANFTKSKVDEVTKTIEKLEKAGYRVVKNEFPSKDTDRVFDKDKSVDQIFNVTVAERIIPVTPGKPVDPTDPNLPKNPDGTPVTPSTPEPDKPVFPNDPNSPVWPNTVKDLVTEKSATRTIKYVDRNGKEVSETRTETIKFTREAKVNLVTGEITYGGWTTDRNDDIFNGYQVPVVKGYIAKAGDLESSTKDVQVTPDTIKDINETVIYDKLGSWIPNIPGTPTNPITYPNDPKDPTKPGTDKPKVPYVPGFIPVDPEGQPLKPVDPNDPTKGYEVPNVPGDPTKDTPINYVPNDPKPNPTPYPGPNPAPAPKPEPKSEPKPEPKPNPETPKPVTPADNGDNNGNNNGVPTTPAQPVAPSTPQYMDGQRELPNTGTEDHASLAALGLLGALSGFGLIARKKREDEE